MFVTSVLWITVESQHFCESYNRSNGKVMAFTDIHSDGILLIIGSDFWKITTNESVLSFESEVRLPNDSSETLGGQYLFAIGIRKHDLKADEFAFYKVLNYLFIFIKNTEMF